MPPVPPMGDNGHSRQRPRVLVVDDQPVNIKLLERMLAREQMEVISALNGADAIDLTRSAKPDVILLDVMMPELDGLEVCRRLKANEETRSIPIIFVTARTGTQEKVEGLDAGAADYLTKPIDIEETRARVRTQLRIQEMHRENLRLQADLAKVKQAAAVGAISEGIAHNLNNLLGVAVGYLDLLKEHIGKPERAEKARKALGNVDKAFQRMVSLIRQLNAIARETPIEKHRENIVRLVRQVADDFAQRLDPVPEIDLEVPAENLVVFTNADVVEGVLRRLLQNAIEAFPVGTPGEIRIVVRLEETPDARLIIEVRDRGEGIPEDIRDSIFDPFVSGKADIGRGMGLTSARHQLRALGGEIELFDNPGGGTVARLEIPLDDQLPLPHET